MATKEEILKKRRKNVENSRERKLSLGISGRILNPDVDEDFAIIEGVVNGTSDTIDVDDLRTNDEDYTHEFLYATITGFSKDHDKKEWKKSEKDEREFRNRAVFAKGQDNKSTFLHIVEYKEDNLELAKGSVITAQAVRIKKGGTTIHETKEGKDYYTTYAKGGWLAVNGFVHKTSAQELQVASLAVQTSLQAETAKID